MWERLDIKDKAEYKRMILAFTSLSEMFAQKATDKIAPILNSKYQETVFQKVFKATAEDIGNSAYDASLKITVDGNEYKYLIGIKTFGIHSGDQKIAQFKANIQDWNEIVNEIQSNAKDANGNFKEKDEINQANKHLYEQLAKEISIVRNKKIKSAEAKLLGFSILEGDAEIETVYHVLMPSGPDEAPSISVGETSYNKIDIDNITVEGCTKAKNPANFTFNDGHHRYKYTSADSQLLMDFDNQHIVREVWNVKYAEDAYKIFSEIANTVLGEDYSSIPIIREDIEESYTWPIKIEKYSGFNSFFGTGSHLAKDDRPKRIKQIEDSYKNNVDADRLKVIVSGLETFLLSNMKSDQKVETRNHLLEIAVSLHNEQLYSDLIKLLYRPKDEIYIPVYKASQFHNDHPNFFGQGIGRLVLEGKKKEVKEKRFILVFEPSGTEIECFITQDSGKGIESVGKQSVLGEWLLRHVFQLGEYEPLTEKRLEELEINGIQLYKVKNDDRVHLRFVWMNSDDENIEQANEED